MKGIFVEIILPCFKKCKKRTRKLQIAEMNYYDDRYWQYDLLAYSDRKVRGVLPQAMQIWMTLRMMGECCKVVEDERMHVILLVVFAACYCCSSFESFLYTAILLLSFIEDG